MTVAPPHHSPTKDSITGLELSPNKARKKARAKRKPPTTKAQIDSLAIEDRRVYNALNAKWKNRGPGGTKLHLSDAVLLRYLRHHAFNESETWHALQKLKKPNVRNLFALDATMLHDQLRSKTLFPLPGLRTRGDHEVFYMKPSRYHPKHTPTSLVIQNLAYIMNCMLEKKANAENGIAFLANMNDWTFEHFSTDYCRQFMNMLQGKLVPVRVTMFFIVNPPQWFGKVWQIMKPMLSPSFQKKVYMLSESELFVHLPFNYEQYMPDDFETGRASTVEIVDAFVRRRLQIEADRARTAARPLTDTSVATVSTENSPMPPKETSIPVEVSRCGCGLFYRGREPKPQHGVEMRPRHS